VAEMNHPKNSEEQPPAKQAGLRRSVLSRLPERLRRWLGTAYAAHGGMSHMNLRDWCALEEDIKRKLEHERFQP